MKKVAIIGYGFVGKAVADFFKDNFEVIVYDPFIERIESNDLLLAINKDEVNYCDLAVVCVPTEQKEDHRVDLSIIEETLDWLEAPLILIKSTVPPGTVDKLCKKYPDKKIAFSPEYIGEGKYVVQWWKDKGYPHATDMKYHDFQIFGGTREVTTEIVEFFKKVLGPDAKYMQTDSKTAELVKYMINSWGATKVTFCNEFAKIAESFGIDYNELRELALLDGRIERMHTIVFKDNKGFGGKCFPKDVNGIVRASGDAGYEPELLKEVLKSNDRFVEENK